MDELDLFWGRYFGTGASMIERRLLAEVMTAIEPGDPLFVVAAMLTRQLYISLGETEKALLQFGPALSKRMAGLEAGTAKISSELATILRETKRLERSMSMIDARVIDRGRSVGQRAGEIATAMVNADFRATLSWVCGLCLAFIAGVVAVVIWTP